MEATVVREFSFEAAHHLEGYDGLCKNVHGHSYRLQVEVTGQIVNGMVADFSDVDTVVNELIIKHLDHNDLNDVLRTPLPTAEVIACDIWGCLQSPIALLGKCKLSCIRLWETSRNYVEYRGE